MQDAAFRDRAVYLAEPDALVLADLHLGRAAAADVEAPLEEHADLRERLRALLDRFGPAEVVFAGDLLHEFDRTSGRVETRLRALLGAVREASARPLVIAGNHDPVLTSVWDGEVHDAVRLADDTVVCHGHETPAESGRRYVIGHDHPTIEIEGQRHPCFLYAPAAVQGSDLLMLPSFTPLAPGVRVNRMDAGEFHSPLIEDADALQPIVHDSDSDETLRFPALGQFRSML